MIIKRISSFLMLVCLQATAAEFDLNAVVLGKLKIGSAISVIQQQLPHCTFTKNERTEWGAGGLFHQNWQSKSCGVEFDIVSDTKNSAQSISSMSIQSPSTLVTDRGVSIGSNASDITSHYKNYVNSEESPPQESHSDWINLRWYSILPAAGYSSINICWCICRVVHS